MRIFALSDPHLALGLPGKSMDVFGWHRHHRRIEESWQDRVRDEDLVLVAGDISWAMRIPDAQADLNFLGRLRGQKVIIKGNHDYWWSTLAKVRKVLPDGMHALQGGAMRLGEVLICGTRLWDVPGVRFDGWIDWKPNPVASDAAPADPTEALRIYEREMVRLTHALGELEQLAAQAPARLRIGMLHYPPCPAELTATPVTDLLEQHQLDHVVFGHLHAVRAGATPFGPRGRTTYHLTSCDFLDFSPILVAEL